MIIVFFYDCPESATFFSQKICNEESWFLLHYFVVLSFGSFDIFESKGFDLSVKSILVECFILPTGFLILDYIFSKHKTAIPKKLK
jgi:hypothetical protein